MPPEPRRRTISQRPIIAPGPRFDGLSVGPLVASLGDGVPPAIGSCPASWVSPKAGFVACGASGGRRLRGALAREHADQHQDQSERGGPGAGGGDRHAAGRRRTGGSATTSFALGSRGQRQLVRLRAVGHRAERARRAADHELAGDARGDEALERGAELERSRHRDEAGELVGVLRRHDLDDLGDDHLIARELRERADHAALAPIACRARRSTSSETGVPPLGIWPSSITSPASA